MIAFFRKIRQRLLNQNQVSRYLLYAAGEILLVVIGILIALQINNLNQSRQDRDREQMYLQGLNYDLLESRKELNRVFNKTEKIRAVIQQLMGYASDSVPLPPPAVYDSLIEYTFNYTLAMTNEGTINDILGSGELKVIQNDSLRRKIASWDAGFKMIREREVLLKDAWEKHMEGFATITDLFTYYTTSAPLLSEKNQRRILNDTLYRNRLSDLELNSTALNHYYRLKIEELDGMIRMTERELKKK